MPTLPLRRDLVYGPVHSRRLGHSLGVNLFPGGRKVCSFDCIYCQYGRTPSLTLRPEAEDLADPEAVLRAVAGALRAHPETEYITFSGCGEPTLHPAFPDIVAAVRSLLGGLAPSARVAVLSNSSMVRVPAVAKALAQVDAPIMKLDAGDSETFARINRPAPGLEFADVLCGLRAMDRPVIQALFVAGPVTNASGAALDAWLDALAGVRPRAVQVYSTDRPVAEAGVKKVPPEALQRIAGEASRRTGVTAKAYWR